MGIFRSPSLPLVFPVAIALLVWASPAAAEKVPRKPGTVAKAGKPAKAVSPKGRRKPAGPAKQAATPTPREATQTTPDGDSQPADAPRAASPETLPERSAAGTVKAAGTTPPPQTSSSAPVQEQQSSEGVKTYRFGAIEVEGRLRSPQIIYFLRRVRAEFDAAALGHRSFLRELADTSRDSAFR